MENLTHSEQIQAVKRQIAEQEARNSIQKLDEAKAALKASTDRQRQKEQDEKLYRIILAQNRLKNSGSGPTTGTNDEAIANDIFEASGGSRTETPNSSKTSPVKSTDDQLADSLFQASGGK